GVLRTVQAFTSSRPVTLEGEGGVIEAGADLDLQGAMGGNGNILKRGAGMLTLSGNGDAYSGTIDVAEAMLNVTGQFAQARIEVAHEAVLTGTGRVGSLQVDGTLVPGNLWGGGTL